MSGRTAARAVWLGLVSGAADAAGWMRSGVFPAHMTGNTALLGVALVEHHAPLALLRAVTVSCFLAGLLLAPALDGVGERFGLSATIAGASLFALAASLVGTPPRSVFPLDVLLLAVALAMQNAALHRFAGKSFNTGFLTGNLQSFGAAAARRLVGRAGPEERDGDRVTLRIVPMIWSAYVAGAALGALFALRLSHPLLPISLAIPFVLLLIGRDGT